MRRISTIMLLLLLLVFVAVSAVSGQEVDRRPDGSDDLSAAISDLKLDTPIEIEIDGVDPTLLKSTMSSAGDPARVIIRLKAPAVAEQGLDSTDAQAEIQALESSQLKVAKAVSILDSDAKILGQTQVVLNAIFAEIDPAVLPILARSEEIESIRPVADYELDLSETVPYIGATAVQNGGVDGSGVTVAVLDSGIDYYHAALGGSGDPADYAADDPTIIEPGSFPTAKVVAGYDFVGSDWPALSEAPDPDPLDDGPAAGHGTHVSHIIGGEGGVAPGVDLVGVKVCSSVSTSCSGVALIMGMEYAVDPNGDGDSDDAVDIINMSLGSNYGKPFDDDLSQAVDNATALGVLTVTSAGNGGDKPYIQGTPGSAETSLSVAQTQVPSAALQLINVDGANYPAVFQPWSTPPAGVIAGQVQYTDGAGGNLNGCAPFTTDLTGLIVLVDRGGCNFTLKIKNIGDAGGVAGIIGLVAPGAPFSGGDGGDRPIDIPGYMISQADSLAIQAVITGGGGAGTIDPGNQLPLVGQMVGSSSRGPQHDADHLIKPEIGAPGASVSAIAGTGTGEGPFGGTSGAAPMVTGTAALLLDGFDTDKDDDDDDSALAGLSAISGVPFAAAGLDDDDCDDDDGINNPARRRGHGDCDDDDDVADLSPLEVKALLMNNGYTDIETDPFTGLAPISRIGGGEVRVDDAMDARFAAWDNNVYQGGLSFGFVDVSRNRMTLTKTVRVRNYTDDDFRVKVTPVFRYADDEASGAVQVRTVKRLKVREGDTLFRVRLTIDGRKLPGNFMNSGSEGANPDALTMNEFDGYLILDDGVNPIHLPWHVLPRQAAKVKAAPRTFPGGGSPDTVKLINQGVGTAQVDPYSLIALSPNLPEGGAGEQAPTPDIRAVGINTIPVPAGYCSTQESFLWTFAINTWERQEHLLPMKHFIYLDIDQDSVDDYIVMNNDQSIFSTGSFGTISDGRQLTVVWDLNAGAIGAYFYAEHAMNTGNTILTICGEQVGLTGTDMLATNVNMRAETFDFYYGGPGDFVDGLTVTPLGEQYYGVTADIAGRSVGSIDIYDFGQFPGNSPEYGVMLFTNGDRGAGARGGATEATEAVLIKVR